VTEIIIDGDGFDDPCDCFIAESGDPNRDDSCFCAGPEVLAQLIIEATDLFDLRRRHCSLLWE
jgi:hypothetical protein